MSVSRGEQPPPRSDVSVAGSSRVSAKLANGADAASVAPTTTTALNGRLERLVAELGKERDARLRAQEELRRTCAELEALEKVLHLRPPAQKKRTYPQ
jgi:hypothetical protein